MKAFLVRYGVYLLLAALDLYTTHLAVLNGGEEANFLIAPLVYSNEYATLFLLNAAAFLPLSLLALSTHELVRIFERAFFWGTVVLRGVTVLNNMAVALGRPELPLYYLWEVRFLVGALIILEAALLYLAVRVYELCDP